MDIYFITDNRPKTDLYSLLKPLLDHGLKKVQLRNKLIPISEIQEKLEYIIPLFERYNAELIINDHLELAHHFEIGVHLGLSDGDPLLARKKLGPEATIGITIHDDWNRATKYKEIVTYVGVGPVFPTTTKKDTKSVLGVERLIKVIQKSPLPVVAIGGIQADTIMDFIAPHPKYIAVCSAICSSHNPLDAFLNLQKKVVHITNHQA